MSRLIGKRIGIVVLVCMLFGTLTACQSQSSAKEYTKALFDVAYGKDTKAYAKVTETSEADAKKYMEQSLQAEAEYLAQFYGLDTKDKKVIDSFADLSQKMYEKASYKVESGQGDKVIVKVKPLLVIQQAKDEVDSYLRDYNVKAYVENDPKATQEVCAKEIATILKQYIGQADYDDEKTMTITVKKEGNKWKVSDEDLQSIDSAIVLYGADTQGADQ